jgi:hypothetical protein
MKPRYALILGMLLTLGSGPVFAQFGKLKSIGEQKANDAIDNLFGGKKKSTNTSGNSTGSQGSEAGGNTSNNPSNNSGGGLTSTPPDVKQNLGDAEVAYKKSSYSEARYALQQAMLGVELEIGNKILKSLPDAIAGLKKIESEDQVTSTGFGWAGLMIERKYNDSKDKQLTVTIANNSAWMSAVNLYFTSGYAQTTGGQQNWKQTKVKGNRAVIEYNQGSGYKLSVPLGQSSLLVYEGVNFATESDMMKAAEAVDIDGVKKMLGEQ